MIIHFLKTLLRLCMGPKIDTPIIPEIIGLPPTKDTASGKMSSNHGSHVCLIDTRALGESLDASIFLLQKL